MGRALAGPLTLVVLRWPGFSGDIAEAGQVVVRTGRAGRSQTGTYPWVWLRGRGRVRRGLGWPKTKAALGENGKGDDSDAEFGGEILY